ncbi:MAG: ATP-binding cassette domain-containing protein, partial [Clostridia bacterium]|nr:ATP-binding cassette domain-containing protein [Clostridia bacterium]
GIVTDIQMIFQDPIASLDGRMTVRETIAEGLMIKGIKDKNVIDEKVFEILEMVGLVREHATRYPHEFSGGQRQRIGIARAIITEPKLIIADEPVSALDVSIQAQVINLLNDLKEEMGLTILFVAHNLSVVKYFSDRIGVMYYGKLVEVAKGDDLYKNPLHPYTKALLSAIPEPNPLTERTRQRVDYDPKRDHDYSQEQPSMVEVEEGHFVYCSPSELEKYKAQLAASK